MNKLIELLEAERPMIPDSNADYDIGYNNGLVMAQAIALKYDFEPVVRCKECEFNHPYVALDGRKRNNCTHTRCGLMWLDDEHFCSYGERRTDERKTD